MEKTSLSWIYISASNRITFWLLLLLLFVILLMTNKCWGILSKYIDSQFLQVQLF